MFNNKHFTFILNIFFNDFVTEIGQWLLYWLIHTIAKLPYEPLFSSWNCTPLEKENHKDNVFDEHNYCVINHIVQVFSTAKNKEDKIIFTSANKTYYTIPTLSFMLEVIYTLCQNNSVFTVSLDSRHFIRVAWTHSLHLWATYLGAWAS